MKIAKAVTDGIFRRKIMTEEIIRSITEAETQAEQMKAEALEKAAAIVADAELRAERKERSAAEVCKAYRETQIKNAAADAETEYRAALAAEKQAATDYCSRVLEGADAFIGEIVGRILGGDR